MNVAHCKLYPGFCINYNIRQFSWFSCIPYSIWFLYCNCLL